MHTNKKIIIASGTCILLFSNIVYADIKLVSLFSDHMVI